MVLLLLNLKIYRFRVVIIIIWGWYYYYEKKLRFCLEERCSFRLDFFFYLVLVFFYLEVELIIKCLIINKENVVNRELILYFYWLCCKEKICYRKENFLDFKLWEFCLFVYKLWFMKVIFDINIYRNEFWKCFVVFWVF